MHDVLTNEGRLQVTKWLLLLDTDIDHKYTLKLGYLHLTETQCFGNLIAVHDKTL